jgi:amino acid adenylation domain-containing protein
VVDTSPEELLIIQRAKVQGAWLLHELLRDAPLDFFVLYSSASSVLNSPLAAGYASANAFLDALACYRRQLSLPALSVNWGFWGEVGMVADFTAGRSTGESMVRLMPTAVALQALERCMAQNQPQIGVFSLDWQLLSRRYPTFSQFPLFSQMRRSGESEKPASKRPDASNDMELSVLVELEPTQRRARLENYLARVVASVLRLPIEQVNLSEPISLWGLDSLTALEIKNQVEKDSGVTLSYVRFLQGASVLELAVMMDEKVQAVVMQSKDRIAAPSLVERPADQPKAWPLSATQESMWFLQQLAPHNIAYNIAYVMRVRSVIDLPTLQRVLSALILRHPALRITIRSDGAERYQEIHDDVGLPIEHIRIEGQEIEQLREAANQIYRRPFDLGHGPVVRAALISRSDDDHLLMLLVHHIACDGWSMGILLNDFVELYAAEVNHTHPRLREIPATFGDFVWRQKQLLASPEGEDLWNYWHEKLRDAPAGLRLPTDFERPSNQTFNGASTSFTVPTELAGRIRELAHQENTTSYAVLLAAFAAYLYSLSGQEDILVGTPVSGRSQSHFEGLVGNLINMIVLRVHYRPEMSFRQLLIQVRQTVLEALDHQDYPFPTLVQRLSPARQPGRPPLFQVTFDYQQLGRYGDIASLWAPDGELRSMDLNGLRLESFYMPQQEGQYELGLQAAEGATELFGAFKYNSDLYLPETIQQMQADFLTLLEANVIDPSRDVLSERSQPKGVNIMNLPELLSVLRQKDIQINLDQGRLRVNAPAGALTPDLQAELVAHKTEIIELLQSFTGSERPSLPKIQASNGRGDAPLSFPQQRLWFLYQFNPQNTAYGIIGALEINGNLDTGCLEKAIFEVVRRHHALRTVFQKNDRGQPVQVVLPVTSFTLPIVDLQATPAEQREAHALEMIYQQAATPFDLSAGPLTRPYLFQLAPQRYWLLLHLHHIIADGWSMNTFLEETNALYQAYVAGRPSPLRELEIQYTDYASWQRRWYTPEMLQTRLDYWKQKLAGPLPILELPSDHPRPTTLSDHGANARDFIAPDLHHKLLQLCSRYEVTLFMLLLAAYKTLLYRYTGQTDLLVGAPVANRERSEIEPLIGLFVNTIVLRSDLSGNPSFLDLLYQVRETTLQAFAHQDTPFEMIVEAIHPERDTSHTPIFQVFFTLQNFRLLTNDLAGVEVRPVMLESRASKFDLSLTLGESPLGYIYDIEYNPDLFDADTIGRMMHHYRTILEEVCLDVVRPIGEIPLLTEAERQTFTQWNATEQEYPHDLTLPALFEAQVDRSPDGVAVYDEASQVSYAELDRLANQLAAYLRSLGVGPETRVGLCLPRTLDMVASLLAVMKAGAAYVPLDPAFPAERLAYMLEDSAAPVLLTDSSLAGHFQTEGLRVVCIDTDAEVIATHSERRFESGATPDNLAYIIYTSGSTGKPKGVQVLQRGLVNFLCSMQRQPGLEASDRLVSVTTLSFDIAGLELYLPLISGAQLIVVSSQTASDGGRLRRVLEERQATITQATPATWRLLLAAGWQGSPDFKILCGGEALPEDLSAELLKRCGSLWNLYGPTETTVWSTLDRTLPGQPITVGRPIANTQIYILDAYGQPLPIGVPGELYIGGDGVARGYLNRPELTQEKFLPDPFSQHPEARMYRTGDLARWRPDGRIEFLGRIDHQVKLRGFRIELGEIENVLTQHPAIRQAVVLAREDTPGDKRLAAYLTVHPNAAAPTVSELRAFLQTQLPEYMLPAVFTTLEAFPLTPNGKVDRRALPAPETSRPELANNFVAPRNETERMLAGIWQEALKLEQVGVDDNFFELGGHSLLVVQIHQQILLHFQTDLTIAQMFQFPTIRSLAQHLSRSTVEPASSPRQSAIDRAARSRAAIDRWKK